MRVWVLSSERNIDYTSDVLGVYATRAGAEDALATAEREAREEGEIVYGDADEFSDESPDWTVDFSITPFEVNS